MIKSRRDDFSFFHFYQREWNCPPCLFDGCDDNWVFLDIVAQSELPVIKECLHLGHYEHYVDLHNGAKKLWGRIPYLFLVFIKGIYQEVFWFSTFNIPSLSMTKQLKICPKCTREPPKILQQIDQTSMYDFQPFIRSVLSWNYHWFGRFYQKIHFKLTPVGFQCIFGRFLAALSFGCHINATERKRAMNFKLVVSG